MNYQTLNFSTQNSKSKPTENKLSISTSFSKTTRGISAHNRKNTPGLSGMDISKLITQTSKKTENTLNRVNPYNPYYTNVLTRSIEKAPIHSLSPPKRVDYDSLIPAQSSQKLGKKTLVLDLDETLIHSGFQPFSCGVDIRLKVKFILKR